MLTPAPARRARPPLPPPRRVAVTGSPRLRGVGRSRAAAPRSESPGQAPAHSSLSAGEAAAPGAREQPRRGRAEVRPAAVGASSARPRVARSGSLWRRLREMRRVHAARGCGPALVPCRARPRQRSTAGRRQPLGTRRRGSRGAGGGGAAQAGLAAPTREWASPGGGG